MALKKSQLYSSLWQSCDELRGGMDASQYKDYVLALLFVKYISDKYASKSGALIDVPVAGGFADMVKLKGDKEIGDKINKIIGRLAEANDLKGVIDQADFNDESKLGTGKEMQERLSKLVAIFENLDFRTNVAEGDDLLGDAYEYLMRHFATESGKSKGQFYTPAEVSRVMAQVIGIDAGVSQDQTIYDPTCGSGSLLLRAADQAPHGITIYGQEMDVATWALARMNLILHGHPTAEVWRANTLASPYFKNQDGKLKLFDFAVVNPPFSVKAWSNGFDPANDEFGRFEYGIPPAKNGDYAFLLHVIASLKSKGKGAIILPHGVLFRGNKEANIRRNIINRGFVKGIIGLPANLFYGTGIPACIMIIDKIHATSRKGIFMIDASKGFVKDGNKNRLREQDIHQIVDVFNSQVDVARFARMVPVAEIANSANDYNLNIPRYIDTSESEDLHDLNAHLNGGIPNVDLDALSTYWEIFPSLRAALFKDSNRDGYSEVRIETQQIKATILEHAEFKAYTKHVFDIFESWCELHKQRLNDLKVDELPREVIQTLSEDLLERFSGLPLLSRYDVYQRLMEYWAETMLDDISLIVTEGWDDGRILRTAYEKEAPDFSMKKGNKTFKYVGELIPINSIITRFLSHEQTEVMQLKAVLVFVSQQKEEFEEEHTGDEGALNGLEGKSGITITNVLQRVEVIKEMILNSYPENTPEYSGARAIRKTTFGTHDWTSGVQDENGLFEELDILYNYLQLVKEYSTRKKAYNEAIENLYEQVKTRYRSLTEAEIKALIIEDKWFASLRAEIKSEVEMLTQKFAGRVNELDKRYSQQLSNLEQEVEVFSTKVEGHLKKMGLAWG